MKRLFVGLLIVLCVLIAVGCAYNEEAGVYTPELSGSSLRDTVLYYETDGGFLIPVMKQIPWEEGIGKAALSYLVATTANTTESLRCSLKPTIPDGTTFSLKIDDEKNAMLDVQNMPKLEDKDAESIFIQSVVNTLTEFDTIDTVSLRFDGKKVGSMPCGTGVRDKMSAFRLNTVGEDIAVSSGKNAVTVYVPDGNFCYNIPMTGYLSENDFESAMKLYLECCKKQSPALCDTELVSAKIKNGIATVRLSDDFMTVCKNSEGVSDAIARSIYLSALELGDVDGLELYAGEEEIEFDSVSVISSRYVNEWK